MRSIIDFIRRALASVARFTYLFVRAAGEECGRWIRVLQPQQPATDVEPARTVDEMLPTRSTAPGDEPIYAAVAEIAQALAAGATPRAQAAQLLTADLADWMALLSPHELQAVGQLSPTMLRAHLTGRLRIPALLRMSTAEMLERRDELTGPKRSLDFDDDLELAASAF
jgi:hypothetical protein